MMTLDQLVAQGMRRQRLPRLEARMLLACATGRSPEWLVAHGLDEAEQPGAGHFLALVQRRARGEPMAYLCGVREFFSRPFRVTPAVLIPRPETELLVEVALALMADIPAPHVLDLGTGSGILAVTLALERQQALVTATDASRPALEVAQANATALGASRIRFRLGDWWAALQGMEPGFDLVVSNPPYIAGDDPHLLQGDLRFEPRHALDAGPQGDEDLQRIITEAAVWLRPGGRLALEHGCEQASRCRQLMGQHGFGSVLTHRDLEGRDRVTVGQRPREQAGAADGRTAGARASSGESP